MCATAATFSFATAAARCVLAEPMSCIHGALAKLLSATNQQILAPIRSRCLALRVGAPTHEEVSAAFFMWIKHESKSLIRLLFTPQIRGILEHVAGKEHFKFAPELGMNIAKASNRNLRRAILMLEACRSQRSVKQGRACAVDCGFLSALSLSLF